MTSRHLLPALAVFSLFACTATLLTIEVRDVAETTVARGTLVEEFVGDMGFGDFVSMDVTSSSELQNQGVSDGDIRDVRLEEFRLAVVAPDGADLDFLQEVELYVAAPDLDRVRVAIATDFGPGVTEVMFEIDDVDLTEYVISESMTLETEVTGNRPDEDTDLEAEYALSVGVTGQGACAFASAN